MYLVEALRVLQHTPSDALQALPGLWLCVMISFCRPVSCFQQLWIAILEVTQDVFIVTPCISALNVEINLAGPRGLAERPQASPSA